MTIICLKYVIKIPEQTNRLRCGVFIVNFEQILQVTVFSFLDMFVPDKQRHIQNPVENLRWRFLQK